MTRLQAAPDVGSLARRPPSRMLSVDHTHHQDTTHVIAASGDIDGESADVLRRCIDGVLDQGGRQVVVDLAEVGFMDSTGLLVLVSASNRLRKLGGDLRVASPSPVVLRLLGVTRMETVFSIFGSRDEALALDAPA